MGTGGSERCDERQGKLNYEGERRLLGKGGRKATAHQAEPSVPLRRSGAGCVCTLPVGVPSVHTIAADGERVSANKRILCNAKEAFHYELVEERYSGSGDA